MAAYFHFFASLNNKIISKMKITGNRKMPNRIAAPAPAIIFRIPVTFASSTLFPNLISPTPKSISGKAKNSIIPIYAYIANLIIGPNICWLSVDNSACSSAVRD